jgi:hypothetical protein
MPDYIFAVRPTRRVSIVLFPKSMSTELAAHYNHLNILPIANSKTHPQAYWNEKSELLFVGLYYIVARISYI